MTKAEFLELRAGEQRWILLHCLRETAMTLSGLSHHVTNAAERADAIRAAREALDEVMDAALEEERW